MLLDGLAPYLIPRPAPTVAPAVVAVVAPFPSDAQLLALRACESGGDYTTSTGNSYFGAYQFSTGSWEAVGGTGLPSAASPAEQDRRIRLLWSVQGWHAEPDCSRVAGVR